MIVEGGLGESGVYLTHELIEEVVKMAVPLLVCRPIFEYIGLFS